MTGLSLSNGDGVKTSGSSLAAGGSPGSKEGSGDARNGRSVEVSRSVLSEPALYLKMDVKERPR